jgi:hypothetical protein
LNITRPEDAASQISSALAELDAQKPNEASALIGYANISRVLTSLKANFEDIAADVDGAISTTLAEARATRLRRAADVALKSWDQVIDWVDNNTDNVALVIAQMGLAGTIAGALSYFVGVPPHISFPAAIAGLNGESVWDAIKMFAPKKNARNVDAD